MHIQCVTKMSVLRLNTLTDFDKCWQKLFSKVSNQQHFIFYCTFINTFLSPACNAQQHIS